MPHRVATFFRSHAHSNSNFNSFDSTSKKRTSRTLSALASGKLVITDTSSSRSVSSADSFISMPESNNKRLSLTGKVAAPQHSAANLGVEIESPPLVYYGTPLRSSGALLSGQLKLLVADDKLAVESFRMEFVLEQKMKKPFHAHCEDCACHATELNSWNFLHDPTTLEHGEHDFPFSFLLSGHLPATMHGCLSSIEYVLRAVVTPKTGEPITLTKALDVKRALQPSDIPRQSVRIFPPTNLTAVVDLPVVIHPIGEFNTHLRIDGAVQRNTEAKTQRHWKLKRINWRLEETQKAISPACSKHTPKTGGGPGAKKGTPHQELRILNSGEIKSGWKCDYGSADGSIDVEFPYSIRSDVAATCDAKTPDGTEVTHALIVELIVAEEIAPIQRPTQCTPTGAARVLRMHFANTLTERGGLGISWDEEQPPLYENVPASPPRYGNVSMYEGVPIPDYEELDQLQN